VRRAVAVAVAGMVLAGSAGSADAATRKLESSWQRVSTPLAQALAEGEGGTVKQWRRCKVRYGDTTRIACKQRGVWRVVVAS
jgi:hypothetical protein